MPLSRPQFPDHEGGIVRFAILLIVLLGAGCAEAPPQLIYVPSDMLPSIDQPSQKQTRFAGQTVVVPPVTGVGASNLEALTGALALPGHSAIWSQTFHEALIEGLRKAVLFSDVSPDGASNFILHADILQQESAGYGATITVRYTLYDTQKARDIWTQDIAATYSFTLNPATFLAPGNTQSLALMRACGKNIGILIERLEALPAGAA